MRENLTWKVVLILVLVGLAGIVVGFGYKDIKLGFDLKGGVEMRYRVEGVLTQEEKSQMTPKEREARQLQLNTKVNETVDVIRKRVDPDGTLQPDIRAESGGEIVIRLQGLTQTAVDRIKNLVTNMGILEFRMVVPDADYERMTAEEKKTVKLMTMAERPAAGQAPVAEKLYIQMQDEYNITGKNLSRVFPTSDQMGRQAVGFELDSKGADEFAKFTKHLADRGSPDHPRRLAILLNNKLQSAPSVRERISGGHAIIEGIDPSLINDQISILQAGSLPTRLIYVSEIFIGPELGSDSLRLGRTAILVSVAMVLVFMCIYYAGSGFIADFAVALNLLFMFAVLIISDSVMTLPGIAGMALTVGMAVDANVLIYERIREELAAGKVLRFAIKNGYERALLVIVDSNLTTVITAVVLWIFLTGPVRWFAVTLTIGLISSMFTSLFVTRVVFDLLVGYGMVKKLRMMQLFSKPNLRFIRWAPAWMTVSAVAIIIGMVAFISRGRENLGIDFTPGSAAQLSLIKPMNIEKVRGIVYGLGYENAQVITAHGAADGVSKTDSNQFVIRIPEKGVGETQEQREAVLDNIQKAFAEYVPTRTITVKVEVAAPIKDTKDSFAGGQLVTVSFWAPEKTTETVAPASPVEGGTTTETPATTGIPKTVEVDATAKPEATTPATVETETPKTVLEPATLSADVITEALSKAGLDKVEVVQEQDRESYTQVQFKTTESSEEKVTKAVTAPGLIVVPSAFTYEQFVGPAQANRMIFSAILAIVVSMFFIVIYVWVRFGNVRYGLAAIIALAHDTLITLGAVAVASYLAGSFVGNLLGIGQVDIDLNVVAALLTIIGYSLNDTIVVFDRIRENRGRRREVTGEMIDRSINQTLSRTVLTSFTTLLVCVTLYIFGGRMLHGLAFCLTVGIVVGTYSSIFIASPLLIVTHMGMPREDEALASNTSTQS